MDENRTTKLVEALGVGAAALANTAATAARGRKGLTGANPYADRFHREVIALTKVERAIWPTLAALPNVDLPDLQRQLAVLKSETARATDRAAALKRVRLVCEVEALPNIGNVSLPVQPNSEPILAASVLASAPTYLQRTLLQANGCYEQRWFDAASVLIRKLVENLIIDVYEHGKKADEIKNKDGDYLMLAGLVTAILAQSHWSLQRETKKALPELKKLGDRAAHNRRYSATRQDIDQLLPGLRVTADDLLHLAGHK